MTTTMTDVVELQAIPIFRTGAYPQGTFDDKFVQLLAGNYDPQFHEAPNYLAHSDDDQDKPGSNLAFGWIKRLYVKGNTLFADFANVPRQFAELIFAGRIKKRSVEIYPDLSGRGPYLRAVAWPLIPELKALADVHPTQVFNDESEFHKIVFQEKETDMSDQDRYLTCDEVKLMIRQLRDDLSAQQQRIVAELEVKNFCEYMVASGKMTPAERATEQPLLVEQRKRELAMTFAEGTQSLSDQRMNYYRTRHNVIDLEPASSHAAENGPADPRQQKLLRYFHDNEEFFTRVGVTFDDLAAVEAYENHDSNPLTD